MKERQMRSTKKRVTALFAALALTFLLLGGIGVSPAYAAGIPHKAQGVTPNSCFWLGDASQSGNIYATNGSKAGYYEVIAQHYSCTTSWHRAFGEIVITSSGFTCTSPTFDLFLYGNRVQVEFTYVTNGPKIGTNGCASSSYSLTTATYSNGSLAYCAEMTGVNFGGSLSDLKAGSSCP